MRIFLLAIGVASFSSCTQQGGLNSPSGGRSPSGSSPFGDSTSSTGITSGGGAVRGVSMRYTYPNIPTAQGAKQYYVTSFAETSPLNLRSTQETLSAQKPPRQILVTGNSLSNGADYCFSNEDDGSMTGVNCAKAASSVSQKISGMQATPTGNHTVFVSALKFNFKHQAQSGSNYFSEAIFEGAYVEKARIRFNPTTGALLKVQDSELMKLTYGNGCQISDLNAVGFNPPKYDSNFPEFLLTGVWSFERTRRSAFGEIETSIVEEARTCGSGNQQSRCNLFADKVSVWHSLVLPSLHNGSIGSQFFPGNAARIDFGRYAQAASGFVSTPELGMIDPRNGSVIPNWDQYFITKLCLRGRRRERLADGNIYTRPLIHVLRTEMRSPYVKKVY